MEPTARRTIVVEGPLAYHRRRLAAARKSEAGVQILAMPHIAARLAGGFQRPARGQDLDAAIRNALRVGTFEDIGRMQELPGMPRAIARALTKLWLADADISEAAKRHGRLRDLLIVERLVRETLPAGALTIRDLRDAALARVVHARTVLGDIELDLRGDVAPLWRQLILGLTRNVGVTWRELSTAASWFPGETVDAEPTAAPPPSVRVSCANPRSEAIEALRWMRELLAKGVPPAEIAISATSTETWDEHFDALSMESALPLHFSHGRGGLATYDGQTCAALADVLIQGLNQRRVRRLFRYARRSKGLEGLLPSWSRPLRRDAALLSVQHWQHALDQISLGEGEIDPRPIVMPIITLLARGPEVAEEAGALLLEKRARALWTDALRRAPASALLLSLEELRLPDRRDPGASVVWCPAHHLAEAPRAYVRLLGLNARSWPRRGSEDPILPSHMVSGGMLDPTWITQQDREHFRIILGRASKALILSRSRRDAQGKTLPPSSLVAQSSGAELELKRTRSPSHAFGEGDRLLARPEEAATLPQINSASLCWQNRQSRAVTAHDGQVREDHPLVLRALGRVQSATSLKALLRDPLGFVWRYGLRWSAPALDNQPLRLEPRVYGELVHDILKHAVLALEPAPGFRQADPQQIQAAIEEARVLIRQKWPLEKPVPPGMLWDHTLARAADLANMALGLDPRITAGSQSWPEALFGQAEASGAHTDLPWPVDVPVPIPGTDVTVNGKIDRLDIRIDDTRRAAQVTDYKTGKPAAAGIILNGGRELQRVTYVLAVRHLRPDITAWQARLVYLTDEGPSTDRLVNIDGAIGTLTQNVTAASALVRRGITLPGEDAEDDTYDLRLAHPASRRVYFEAKRNAIGRVLGATFVESWACP
ncbi:MAG: PD-(D/E)XK nuclease family protein [Alphaproteobacteria bacterium]|nr:PD-(D/E)XK nuclease family protein [Reyranella sp.]MBL6853365.1 PD-(D/E)XK nuclease family protein [Alphaproteobacteria bacterium]MBL6940103.1 PD-(D/E)XK nuclease family protein [Alphaproteobacteria bacterium]MBL7100190.1 PD-(D/E)XK nuclease family protein [Alphaproteobacteria bacterium]